MTKNKPIILCLGNPLFTDEGLGIHVLQRLLKTDLGQYVELIDGGTDGLALLEVVERAEQLIIVDAVDAGLNPGRIIGWEGEQIPLLSRPKLSPHQASFQEVLALAKLRGNYPKRIKLLGIQPYSLDWGLELSPTVMESFDDLINQIVVEIGAEIEPDVI